MISYAEARAVLLDHVISLGIENVPLKEAQGRFLARDIVADRDYPPFNRATMDGYAVRSEDFEKGSTYSVDAWKHAGSQNVDLTEPESTADEQKAVTKASAIRPGLTCIGISTGAAVPEPYDAVVRIEDSHEESPHNVIFSINQVRPWLNIARRGEDVKKGAVVVERGRKITPGVALTLASVGAEIVPVFVKPGIRIVSCGDEIVPVGADVGPEQIRDSNSHTIATFLGALGLEASTTLISDNQDRLKEALRQGLIDDILIVTGGVSKGPHDFIPGILLELGVQKLFHGVAIKPGKPVFAGVHITNGRKLVLALPGNPLSVLVGCEIFLLPYLLACMGSSVSRSWPMKFQGERKKRSALDEFFPSNVNATGMIAAPWNGSGDILAGLSQGFALHPADKMELKDGEQVLYFPWTGS